MKELSIEEKAQRYDETLDRTIRFLTTIDVSPNEEPIAAVKRMLEYIFPELKESEDEKIRKALISILKSDFEKDTTIHDISVGDILAWLEKQGETFIKKDVDDAYLKGVTDTKNELEKQYEANYQIRKDIATFIFNYKGDIKDRAKWIDYLGIKVSFDEKQEWSEKDKCMLNNIIDTLKPLSQTTHSGYAINSMIDWLKSLKDRVKH